MDSIMPRKQLEKILQLRFSTEEGVRESYEELEELFGLHGSTFDIGDQDKDTYEPASATRLSSTRRTTLRAIMPSRPNPR